MGLLQLEADPWETSAQSQGDSPRRVYRRQRIARFLQPEWGREALEDSSAGIALEFPDLSGSFEKEETAESISTLAGQLRWYLCMPGVHHILREKKSSRASGVRRGERAPPRFCKPLSLVSRMNDETHGDRL
jgi:hypothetical protein